MSRTEHSIQAHWWGKSLVAVVLGFTLALGVSGLFAWFGPGGINVPIKNQFNMWLMAPIWMLVLSFSYLVSTQLRLFLYLSGFNLLVYVILFLAKYGVIG